MKLRRLTENCWQELPDAVEIFAAMRCSTMAPSMDYCYDNHRNLVSLSGSIQVFAPITKLSVEQILKRVYGTVPAETQDAVHQAIDISMLYECSKVTKRKWLFKSTHWLINTSIYFGSGDGLICIGTFYLKSPLSLGISHSFFQAGDIPFKLYDNAAQIIDSCIGS